MQTKEKGLACPNCGRVFPATYYACPGCGIRAPVIATIPNTATVQPPQRVVTVKRRQPNHATFLGPGVSDRAPGEIVSAIMWALGTIIGLASLALAGYLFQYQVGRDATLLEVPFRLLFNAAGPEGTHPEPYNWLAVVVLMIGGGTSLFWFGLSSVIGNIAAIRKHVEEWPR